MTCCASSAGYSAFLIGERFMTSADPGRELKRLLRGCRVNTRPKVIAAETAEEIEDQDVTPVFVKICGMTRLEDARGGG